MRPELVAFLISAVVAAVQVVLLSRLFISLKEGKRYKTFLIIMFKIASYVVLCYLLIFKYIVQIMFSVSGFLTGLPITAIILFFIYRYKEQIIGLFKRSLLKQKKNRPL